MTHENSTATTDHRTLVRRIAYAVDRDLANGFLGIEELVRLSPQHTAELRQMTIDIERMQRRVQEIMGRQ